MTACMENRKPDPSPARMPVSELPSGKPPPDTTRQVAPAMARIMLSTLLPLKSSLKKKYDMMATQIGAVLKSTAAVAAPAS